MVVTLIVYHVARGERHQIEIVAVPRVTCTILYNLSLEYSPWRCLYGGTNVADFSPSHLDRKFDLAAFSPRVVKYAPARTAESGEVEVEMWWKIIFFILKNKWLRLWHGIFTRDKIMILILILTKLSHYIKLVWVEKKRRGLCFNFMHNKALLIYFKAV